FGSVFAMTSGMSFAMMGVVFSRQFPFAFLFLAVMLAGPYLPGVQWGLIAVLWWAAMFLPGLSMHREKRRRAHDATAPRRLCRRRPGRVRPGRPGRLPPPRPAHGRRAGRAADARGRPRRRLRRPRRTGAPGVRRRPARRHAEGPRL